MFVFVCVSVGPSCPSIKNSHPTTKFSYLSSSSPIFGSTIHPKERGFLCCVVIGRGKREDDDDHNGGDDGQGGVG